MLAIIIAAVVQASAPHSAYLPDPRVTPGALNPAVTQSNIRTTICVSGWTKTIRPPASYTNKLKLTQMKALRLTGSPRLWEEDHFISLEIGGNPTSPSNLWPEPWADPWGAHKKDRYENYLHREVCAGRMTLAQAQQAITTDWVAGYLAAFPNTGKKGTSK